MGSKSYRSTNPLVRAMLTDMYQFSMLYGQWYHERHNTPTVFEQFFRKCPFKGEFAIFAGLDEVLGLLNTFSFGEGDIEFIRTELLPHADEAFFDWLRTVDASEVKVFAMRQGSAAFPRVPLLIVEAPIGISHLLETPLLNLVNYASLATTNARRLVNAAGVGKILLEFGLRRAQGPDGALTGAKCAVMGGFAASSNVLAGKLYGIKVKGTFAHSWVTSFQGFGDIKKRMLLNRNSEDMEDFLEKALFWRDKLNANHTHEGELASFVAYALAHPEGNLSLVDTYDTLLSGVPNALAVALALEDFGYSSVGIRLDSGDLAELSKGARRQFNEAYALYAQVRDTPDKNFDYKIAASNDIHEDVLCALNEQGHEIDIFGIGTHFITCKAQPAFGGVYKVVEVDGVPVIKISEQMVKVLVPGAKRGYRLVGSDGQFLADVLILPEEAPPVAGQPFLVRDPISETMRIKILPSVVIPLHVLVWDGRIMDGVLEDVSICATQARVQTEMARLPQMHQRRLNPTPYRVGVSDSVFAQMHKLWLASAPIETVS
jgi:nicotinate phosphoribosyltransferase